MSLEVVEAIAENVLASQFIHDQVDLSFHSGEPLIAGLDWFDRVFRVFQSSWPARITPTYSIQSNGILIDDDFAQFLKTWNVRVSISLDGPQALNDANRVNWADQGSFARVMEGIECLQRHNISFGILCVLNADNIEHPDELWSFFNSLKPKLVGFNVEELEGVNRRATLLEVGSKARVREFFRRYVQRNSESSMPHAVRELQQYERFILGSIDGTQISSSTATPFRIVNVDYAGGMSTYSPELMEMPDSVLGNFILGNVTDGKPEDVIDIDKFIALNARISSGIDACRDSCEYFRICGGGSPVNKLCECGSLEATETAFCRNSIQAFADVVMDRLLAQTIIAAQK